MNRHYQLNNYPVWTAVITPFLESGELDLDSLVVLLRSQEEASNGILLLGSTGEAQALSSHEKKRVLQMALDLNLKVPIMVGVGGIHLEETKEWLKYLETKTVDCYLMVTPPYAKPGAKGQEHWFRSLLDAVSRPCMLYNVPGRTGVALNHQAIKNLEGHKNFWAVKEASGSIEIFQSYCETTPSIRYYSGDDAMTPYFSMHGAKGLISVASNVWPKETHLYTQLCIEKRLEGLMPLWSQASHSLFMASNPIPIKSILCQLGIIKTSITRPPLCKDDFIEKDKELLTRNHLLIKKWYESKK